MLNIKHIINIVDLSNISSKSDLHTAQPLAIESIRRAHNYANSNNDNLNVTVFAVYQTDNSLKYIPKEFEKGKLNRSILDFKNFTKNRSLPLIQDILNVSLQEDTSSDYVVYTNIDIIVKEVFYEKIKKIVEKDNDESFMITRRTVPPKFDANSNLKDIFKERGKSHVGSDCFIFRKDYYHKMNFGKIIIGARDIGNSFIKNLKRISNFTKFSKKHLTYHIGNDGAWKKNDEFSIHNRKEFNRLFKNKK